MNLRVLAALLGLLTTALLTQPAVQAHPAMASEPHGSAAETTAATGTSRRLDVFARGTDGTLQHRWTSYGASKIAVMNHILVTGATGTSGVTSSIS